MTKPLERIRVSQSFGARSALEREVAGQGARKLFRELNKIGQDAVERCNQIVSAELVNDRIPQRRKPGRHLLNSFRFEVIGDPHHLPVSLRLYSEANPAKVNAMESGADPHVIAASNSVWLTFPKGRPSTSIGALGDIKFSGSRGRSQIHQAYHGKGTSMARVKQVNHPGNLPHSMMERALKAAVKARLSGSLV